MEEARNTYIKNGRQKERNKERNEDRRIER